MPPIHRVRRSIRRRLSNLSAFVALSAGVPALAGLLLLSDQGGGAGDGAAGGDGTGGGGDAGGVGTAGAGSGTSAAAGAGDAPLGPEGQKALDAFKERARAAEAASRAKDEELQKLRDEKKSDQDKLLDAAKSEGGTTAEAEYKPTVDKLTVENAIMRHVGTKFADLDDAVLNLGDKASEFVEDGKIDVDKLGKVADALLEKKPHLAASGSPAGGGQTGNGGGTARPHQGAGNGNDGKGGADPELMKRMGTAVQQRTGIT